jgi:hemerythrin-like domain-containing protein
MSGPDARAAVQGTAMMENLRRFGTLCGQQCQFIHFHHSIEDQAMFPALRARAGGFAAVIERLRAEHEVVHGLLVALIGDLDALAADPGGARLEAAAATFRTLERFLLSHFGYEESALGDALGVYGVRI